MLTADDGGRSRPHFVQSDAERLPFPSESFDLLTVSMALHWLEQQRFLDEATRVLTTGGELWSYNLFFPGTLAADESFSRWHKEVYLARYPVPPRHSKFKSILKAFLQRLRLWKWKSLEPTSRVPRKKSSSPYPRILFSWAN